LTLPGPDLIPEPWTDRVARRFALLAVPARLELVNRLIADGEQTVQALVHSTGMRQANVSKHLGLLAEDGILERRRDGQRVYYRVVDPTLAAVCTLICGRLQQEAA
jgi:ArsR family transcriptional regulator